jgi:hypothetical protein
MRRASPFLLVAAAVVLLAFGAAPASAQNPAPCAPGSAAAVRFQGLPARVQAGPVVRFGLAAAPASRWVLEGPVHVVVRPVAGGAPLFEADVDTSDTIPVVFGPEDRQAEVLASFAQYDGRPRAADQPSCLRTLRRVVTPVVRALVPARCGAAGSARPRTLVLGCGGPTATATGLRWGGWNTPAATARGALAGFPVTVVATRLRRCAEDGGSVRYTSLKVSYPGRRPAGAARAASFAVPCR